tara:strand:- start:18206 stop:18427 length:222 start_codon:yes stop_codon:yes gene_type:complete
MSKSTKVTYKELNDRIALAFNKLMQVHNNMDYIHTIVLKYIKFKGDEKDFLSFVEAERGEIEKKVREDESTNK